MCRGHEPRSAKGVAAAETTKENSFGCGLKWPLTVLQLSQRQKVGFEVYIVHQ